LNPIQSTFLRSKHWQLFLLWIVVKWFLRITINTLLGNPLFSLPHASDIFTGRLLHQGDDIVLYAWLYFAGSFLNSISPAPLRVPPISFYAAAAGLLMLQLIPFPLRSSSEPKLLAVDALGLLCLFYLFRFPAKALVAAETRQPAPFFHYVVDLFLVFLFFPIGVWFLQPLINKLYAAHQSPATPIDPVRPAAHHSA